MFILCFIGKNVVDRWLAAVEGGLSVGRAGKLSIILPHSTHLTMVSSWSLIVRLMQIFNLRCLLQNWRKYIPYLLTQHGSLECCLVCKHQDHSRAFLCVGGWVVDTGHPTVGMGQNVWHPLQCPSVLELAGCADPSIAPENSALQITCSQCLHLTHKIKWDKQWVSTPLSTILHMEIWAGLGFQKLLVANPQCGQRHNLMFASR